MIKKSGLGVWCSISHILILWRRLFLVELINVVVDIVLVVDDIRDDGDSGGDDERW